MAEQIKERLTKTESGVVHEIEQGGQKMAINLSMEDILMLIKAAKAPDDETVAKKAAEEAKRQQQMAEMLRIAKIEDQNRINLQSNCSHRKQNGESTFKGQIHSDGLYHPLCLRCQKLLPPQIPPRELMSGMGIG